MNESLKSTMTTMSHNQHTYLQQKHVGHPLVIAMSYFFLAREFLIPLHYLPSSSPSLAIIIALATRYLLFEILPHDLAIITK